MKTRTTYSAEFKAKLALEVIKGNRTLAEIASDAQVHPNLRTQWKRHGVVCTNRIDHKDSRRDPFAGGHDLCQRAFRIIGKYDNREFCRVHSWICTLARLAIHPAIVSDDHGLYSHFCGGRCQTCR